MSGASSQRHVSVLTWIIEAQLIQSFAQTSHFGRAKTAECQIFTVALEDGVDSAVIMESHVMCLSTQFVKLGRSVLTRVTSSGCLSKSRKGKIGNLRNVQPARESLDSHASVLLTNAVLS